MADFIKILLVAVLTIAAIYVGLQLTMYQNLGVVSLNQILLGVLVLVWFTLVYLLLRETEDSDDDE